MREHRHILTAAMVGTTIEFYDFFIYATAAALFFGPIFFPFAPKTVQVLASFMTFGVAFFARPFGAIVFGHFGDRIGRKSTLVASLLLMGGSTLAIAFLPTYAMAGWIAPALLCLMRFGQGFALGGEWGGAALLATEYAPQGWRNRYTSVMQLGAPAGYILSNGLFLLLNLALSEAELAAWGWRIPFLLSAILVGVGLWIRLRIEETPAFKAALEKGHAEPVPVMRLFRDHGAVLFFASVGCIVIFATFYQATTAALAQGTSVYGHDRTTFLAIQMVACVFFGLGMLTGGRVADGRSATRTMRCLSLGVIPIGLAFGVIMGLGSLLLIGILLCATMFVGGLGNGPLGNWLGEQFPVAVRYTGVSLAFNIGGIIGGATTPLIGQVLSERGLGSYSGFLLSLAGLISLIGVLKSRTVSD